MDSVDRLAEQARDAEDDELVAERREAIARRNGVGDDDVGERRVGEPLRGEARKHRMRARRITSSAPRSLTSRAASQTVPPVEIMSSNIRTLRPDTSPIRLLSTTSVPLLRRLSMIASSQPRALANMFATLTLPTSGETTTQSPSRSRIESKCLSRHGRRSEVVDGKIEEALDLRRVQVHAEHAVGAGRRR